MQSQPSAPEHTKRSRKAFIIGVLVFGIVTFSSGVLIGATVPLSRAAIVSALLPSDPPAQADLTPVWRAWNVIDERFAPPIARTEPLCAEDDTECVEPEPYALPDAQEKVWGMIQGLAASLNDPYTVFLPPSEAKQFNDDISGSFEGVGMEIAIRDQILTVVSPLKGTPASLSGIKSADRIIEIDGVSTRNMGIDDAVSRIRGPQGTEVIFTIVREGASDVLTISVTRDVINIPTIETRKEGDVFVIELLNFSAPSAELFRNALQEFIDAKTDKLIIDLRGNPGGFLDAAVDMASWFLPSGKVVVTEDYGDGREDTVHRSRGYNVFTDELKMVILVDRGSASASEILAGALRAHEKATLIGTRSFGKGSVQELVDITADTSLKITIAHWLLPDGSTISNEGIEPDIVVELPVTDDAVAEEEKTETEEKKDLILERALQYLRTGK